MSSQINLLNDYYLQYYIIGSINDRLRLILIDTGASMSHIHNHLIEENKLFPISEQRTIQGYIDLEGTIAPKHLVNNTTEISVVFSKSFKKKVKLEVVKPISIKTGSEILFGMDFLDSFESYNITKEQLILNEGIITHYIPRITVDSELIKERLGY